MPSQLPFDAVQLISERFRSAIARAFPEHAGTDPLIAPNKNPALGDFQCNAAMSLAKLVGKPPREVAATLIEAVKGDVGDLLTPLSAASIAGPGFINLTLRSDALAELLQRLDTPQLGLALDPADKRTIVVDLCGVNLAKQMHVGHLRATVIGDTLARTFERLGHKVFRQNHVGDWGLPIAMVADSLERAAAAGELNLDTLTLNHLNDAYRAAQNRCTSEEDVLAKTLAWHGPGSKFVHELQAQVDGASEALSGARAMLLRMQAKEPKALAVWQRISDVTMAACLEVCRRLNADVRPEHSAGESSYSDRLGAVADDLAARRIAKPEGAAQALVINFDDIPEPLFVRRSDGGFLYSTTDLAAIKHRVQTLGADRVVYAVDARQSLHFKQVFAAATRAGYATKAGAAGPSELEHALFGTILGADGRPFKTRTGENVKLADLLDEAEERATAVVAQKNPEMPADQCRAIARPIAVAAIRYADLSNERVRDYVFSFDRMLAFEGNTGPYLLYALVRIRKIFREAGERGVALPAATTAFVLSEPAEKSLALALLRYPGAVRSVGESAMPHRLCQYLYDLASAFSAFYDACHVLNAKDGPTRAARLKLCQLTERVLADGLGVLGIPTLERM